MTVTTGFLLELAPASALTVADTGVKAGGEGTGPPTAGTGAGVEGAGVEALAPIFY